VGDHIELQNQIEKRRKHTEREYAKVLKTVEMLKKKMNELEQDIRKEDPVADTSDSTSLGLAIKSLNELTDSQILRSKKAWEEYRKLENYCKRFAFQPVELDKLRVACKKMEELAADLLCYSLGRFEPTDR
jgi:chromosome segregation ATPase